MSADFDQDTSAGPQEWEVDPKYEFNAPKFIDFTKVDTAEDTKADEWFGKDRALFKNYFKITFYPNYSSQQRNKFAQKRII